jgi:hypothetical protein
MAPYQAFLEALGQHESLAQTASRLPDAVRSRVALLLPAAIPGVMTISSQGGELDRFHLLAAVSALVAAMSRSCPLLLVLEDLHWADRATLVMLLHLARSPERAAALVLVTARDAGVGVGSSWMEALDEMRRHRLAEFVPVRALDDAGVGGLVAGHIGHNPPPKLVAAIGRATDRNPFFVEELVRHLVETGAIDPAIGAGSGRLDRGSRHPHEVRRVLASRMARLSAPARQLLQMAAVLGREFDFTLLSRLTGWEDGQVIEAVEEALHASILSDRGSSWAASYSFRHALVRETLYADISQPRRQSLHMRAVAAIEAAGPLDSEGVAATAVHLRLAGPLADQAKVISLSIRASDAAAAVYAWDGAGSTCARLRGARTGQCAAHQAGAVAERSASLKVGNDLQGGIGFLERALAAYLSVGDVQAAARTHSRLGMHLTTYPATLNVAAGLAHYEAAEAELTRQPSKRRLGYLYVGMSMAAIFAVRTGQLEVASRRAHEIAEELGDEPLAGWASYQRAWCAFNHGRLARSLSLHEQMRDIAGHLDDVNMGSWAALGRALLSGTYLDDPLTARTWCAHLPTWRVFPRAARQPARPPRPGTGSSGKLPGPADRREPGPRHAAERMLLYWSGNGASRSGLDRGRGPRRSVGDRLTISAYWAGRVRRCSPPIRPRPRSPTAWLWRCKAPRYPPS